MRQLRADDRAVAERIRPDRAMRQLRAADRAFRYGVAADGPVMIWAPAMERAAILHSRHRARTVDASRRSAGCQGIRADRAALKCALPTAPSDSSSAPIVPALSLLPWMMPSGAFSKV